MAKRKKPISELTLRELLKRLDAASEKAFDLTELPEHELGCLNKALRAFRFKKRKGLDAKVQRKNLYRAIAPFKKLLNKASDAGFQIYLILAMTETKVRALETEADSAF